MKKISYLTFLFSILLNVIFAQSESDSFTQNKFISDFDYLISELKLQHQGLYEYVEKNQTDVILDSIRNALETQQTKLEFYETLRYVIGLTNEGHTSINLPKWSMIKFGMSKSFIPLAVKLCNENLIVTQNYGNNIAGLKKGAKIVSINGRKVNDIIKKIYPLIPTDGFNETSKNEWVGGLNFSLLYRLVYEKEKTFQIEVQELNKTTTQTLIIPAIRFTKFKTKNAKFNSLDFDYNHFKFQHINDSIAYLSIPSFGDDDIDYEKFYQTNFKKIDSLNIKHLIIDIQANGGGTEGNENLLFSYLSNTVVQKYKQVTMLPKPYHKNKHEQGYIADKWTLKDTIATRGNFTLFSDYYSDLGYKKPKKELIYNGELYILISGKTFSGGAEFASLVKMTERAVFVGEETGGAYEGNVSGYSEYIKLPKTNIEVKIPTVHFQINVQPKIKGRGIIPDYEVSQTWKDYLKGKNTKKDFIIKMITK
ncbi:S41 family peptidase [Mesoflavibacter zeaxanthinifaciens]|uniref:S41 family peptidase n=1 Tax=Mesoflavibacter zeaxanthinifaciens TaxID=393060 RepID=UPI003A94B21F